jgi:glutamate dehydrogenase/leucine dehydrogenase
MGLNEQVDEAKARQKTPGKAFSRRRLKTFMDQPQERTELIGQFESILGIATGGDRDTPFRTADEVESLVIDATRKLGNSSMRQGAQGAQERVIGDSKKAHPKARL